MSELQQVIQILEELEEDITVSRNIKEKIREMRVSLQSSDRDSMSLTVNRILSDLEDLSNDVNIPDFVRTQFWHLTSILETIA